MSMAIDEDPFLEKVNKNTKNYLSFSWKKNDYCIWTTKTPNAYVATFSCILNYRENSPWRQIIWQYRTDFTI